MYSKQARRIGKSSLLGERLDHICDSFTTVFLCIILLHTLHVSYLCHLLWFIVMTATFYLDHWQACTTRRLIVGNKYFSSDEMCITLAINIILWGYNIKVPWIIVLVVLVVMMM